MQSTDALAATRTRPPTPPLPATSSGSDQVVHDMSSILSAASFSADSLKGKEAKVLTPVIDGLERDSYKMTAGEYAKQVLNKTVAFPGDDVPLYDLSVSPQQTKEWFEAFAKNGMQDKNWKLWFTDFSDTAIYISDSSNIHVGRETIAQDIGAQIELVSQMDYRFLTVVFDYNSVTVSSNNIMTTKGGDRITYVNISQFWYDRDGKVKAAVDTIDKTVAGLRTVAYLAEDANDGGDATCGFCSGLVKIVKQMCGCMSKTKGE